MVSEDTEGKFLTVKKLGLTIFAAAVLAVPLCAQVATLRADIPFEFTVGKTTVPAGTYVIGLLAGQAIQVVGVGSDFQNRYFFTGTPNAYSNRSHEPKLVFHRYGNRYFLSEVWSTSPSFYVPVSPAERELKKSPTARRQFQTEIVLAMR